MAVAREALARHPLAITGALLTTVSAALFIALVIAVLAGWLVNPVRRARRLHCHPAAFIIGLLLIPLGHAAGAAPASQPSERRRQTGRCSTSDMPMSDERRSSFSALTAVNIVIVLLAGYGTLHWMESPTFCGQVCHTPMHPQFTALQAGPHARVACVDCHIGEGARGIPPRQAIGRAAAHSRIHRIRFRGRFLPAPRCLRARKRRPAPSATQPGRAVGDRIR